MVDLERAALLIAGIGTIKLAEHIFGQQLLLPLWAMIAMVIGGAVAAAVLRR